MWRAMVAHLGRALADRQNKERPAAGADSFSKTMCEEAKGKPAAGADFSLHAWVASAGLAYARTHAHEQRRGSWMGLEKKATENDRRRRRRQI